MNRPDRVLAIHRTIRVVFGSREGNVRRIQQFNWHNDGAFERANGERSWITFMVYLNAGFEGGTTSFVFGEVVPQQGMALFFPHELPHCGAEVAAGRKYVLRSDIMFARITG